jgi:hypothetical protein
MQTFNTNTLVVVDMQPYFSCEKQILQTCKREIKKAIAANNHIVFLEFTNCGVTDNELMLMMIEKGYSNYSIVSKNQNDGSLAIADKIKPGIANLSSFRVCGVYTDACVFDTVKGLLKRFNCNVEVVRDAVRTTDMFIQLDFLEKMSKLSSVSVV